ncbi:MAG: hypothetical protein H6703_05190 [Myxococcales bacterium]|nr:hypothetical protein [Myxococcales bacterium]
MPDHRLAMTLAASLGLAWGCVPEADGGDDDPVIVIDIDQGPGNDGSQPEPTPDADPTDPTSDMGPPETDMETPEADMGTPPTEGLAVLGGGRHSADAVEIEVIATAVDGLDVPRDLDFNPWAEGVELWVVNRADDSTTTIFAPGTPDQTAIHLIDPYALHFMEEVSSIDFGQPGTFGTCQESRNTYNGLDRPNDFMGPTLWPSDLDVYARSNPEAVAYLGFDLGSHLDMLHQSPLCMGIAWQEDNVYWVFEGQSSSIAQVDFREDHGPGFDDHSDGIIVRYAEGEVRRVADVPSHLVFDHETARLYIADTGNARVAMLDTTVGEPGRRLPAIEPGTELWTAEGEMPLATVFADAALVRPSGLAMAGGVLYVGDNATGRIWGVGLDGGVIDYLDTGLPDGALMGIEVGPGGALWVTDAVADRVLRIAPRAQ